jgi:dihydrofolate reductase
MGLVIAAMTMSLDGFIAFENNEVGPLFNWYVNGGANIEIPSGGGGIKVSQAGADFIREASRSSGALVTGRRTFDFVHGWGGMHPMNVPVVVLTHHVPQEWVKDGSPFTFVTDGIESAIEKAQRLAGDKNIAVGTASTTQQCLKAGLLDGIHVDLAPVLLGQGIRFFEYLGEPIELEITEVNSAPDVTHITYRVVK